MEHPLGTVKHVQSIHQILQHLLQNMVQHAQAMLLISCCVGIHGKPVCAAIHFMSGNGEVICACCSLMARVQALDALRATLKDYIKASGLAIVMNEEKASACPQLSVSCA